MPRELVYQTLEMEKPKRAARDLWALPWAGIHYPEQLKKIRSDFTSDIKSVSGFSKKSIVENGTDWEEGIYTDAWGCEFVNIQRGVIGEVRNPIISDEDWEDLSKVHFPVEWMEIDKPQINSYCKENDMFTLSGFCARPFERLQFLRGTENLYMDLIIKPDGMIQFIKKLHQFNLDLMEKWAQTDIDALFMMDDWGAQNNLLINPEIWVEIFKPMYKDYCDLAKSYHKKIFMHSDGNILKIYPHLIEIGVDALNSQIFCMGLENLKQYKGKITFWGELDRQHILVDGTLDDVRKAVHSIKENLWTDGGVIAQCEFGAGARPENVYEMFKVWNEII
ncbi:MAG: methyltransferase [Clostridia bacterium]|nr:methyltransferase [Clostridia bacterium]